METVNEFELPRGPYKSDRCVKINDTENIQENRSMLRAPLQRQHSIVDSLLFEIYDRWYATGRDSFESDTFTEGSVTSDAWQGPPSRTGTYQLELEQRHSRTLNRAFLQTKGVTELRKMVLELKQSVTQNSAQLIRHLKRRDQRLARFQRNCDVLTAIIQAISLKRQIDTRMRFSIQPLAGDDTFTQWLDAMKAVARLPMGIPPEFRKRIWLSLADNHIKQLKLDWDATVRLAFNDKSNPDDDALGMQIVKDLHRTGCNGFSGQENEHDRAVLKRVLLAYARWNKSVGYCQGFNVLAAMILEAVNRCESDALKVMILLIDHVLPESYFCNNLRALSVDMAVFRDLLRLKLPRLSSHLDYLQHAAKDCSTGSNYEPPLTNVFTMQWFLTLFATCLPKATVLRLWDSILMEGSEILLRTTLAIWSKLARRIIKVQSADEFYCEMGNLTRDMLQDKIVSADDLIKMIYNMAPFPFPHLDDLREKYTYNITPFQAALNAGKMSRKGKTVNLFSDDDDDDDIEQLTCFAGIFPQQQSAFDKIKGESEFARDPSDISGIGPGAYSESGQDTGGGSQPSAYQERMCTDLNVLKNQYKRLKQRQQQAHIILTAAQHNAKEENCTTPNIETPSSIAMNHLFISKEGLGRKNRCIRPGPRIVPSSSVGLKQKKKGPSQGYPSINGYHSTTRSRSLSTRSHCSSISIADSTTSVASGESSCTLYSVATSQSSSDESQCTAEIGDQLVSEGLQRKISTLRENSFESEYSGAVSQDECFSQLSSDTTDSDKPTYAKDDEHISNVPDYDNEILYAKDKVSHTPCESLPENTVHDDNIANIENTVGKPSCNTEIGSKELTVCAHDTASHSDDVATDDVSLPKVKKYHIIGDIDENNSRNTSADDDIIDYSSRIRPVTVPLDTVHHMGQPATGVKPVQFIKPSIVPLTIPIATVSPRPKNEHCTTPLVAVPVSKTNKSKTVTSPNGSSFPSSPTSPNRNFNPFPSRHVNKRLTENGLKLGLYSPQAVKSLNVPPKKPLTITRAHISKSLHRQYMADVKSEGKAKKSL